MSSSQSKTVLITGASAGIGAALARTFAQHGHSLILVARRQNKLEELAAELQRSHGCQCHCIVADLTAPDAGRVLFNEVASRGLTVDVLVNNAGLLCEGHFSNTDFDAQMAMLQLNIITLTALCHLFLGPMLERGYGRILNVASTSAFQPVPTVSTYGASKAYVLSMTEALAAELAETGVTATALCPGFTETDMIIRDGKSDMSLPMVRNLTAEEVAEQGYKATMKGKAMHITGLGNRLAIGAGRMTPRVLRRLIDRQVARKGF